MTPPPGITSKAAQSPTDVVGVHAEQLFRAIFEQAAVGIALIGTASGRILQINQRYGEIVGLSWDDMLATTFMAITRQDVLQADLHNMEELKVGRIQDFSMEKRYVRPDGSIMWVNLTVVSLWELGQQPTVHIALVQDITERKQAEETLRQLNETLEQRIAERTEALRASEAFNREALDSLSTHVAVLDASGVIVAVNRVWERAALRNDPVGQARVSLGADYIKVCERAADTSSEARRTLAGIRDVLAGRIQEFESEYLCARPSGQHQWFSMRVTPVRDRGSCVIAHEDVTARKRSGQALCESEERLRLALDGADMGSWDVDLSTGGAIWNQRHRTLYGYEAHDQPHTMQQWQDRVHPEDLDHTLEAAEQAKQEQTPFIVEHRVCLPRGNEQRWISLYGRFRYDDMGTPVRFSGISLDITERRRVEAERQKFVSLVENSRDFIGICDGTLQPVYVNAAGLQLVGLDGLAHACRVTVPEYFFEEDRSFITEEFSPRVRREGHGEVEIHSHHFKTGWPIWMLYHVFPLQDGDRVVGWATVSRDITERKWAEVALRDAHVLLHNIIKTIPDLIVVKDQGLRTMLCNNAFAQAQGKTPNELIGHTDIENGWSSELVQGNLEKGIRGVEQDNRDALGGRVVHNPYDPANVNGKIRIFDIFKVPLQDATGNITGVLGVARDITERKYVEDALRDSYQRLQTLSREVQVAEERERSRLSRELHDEFGQLLSVLKFTLSAMDRKIAGRAARWSCFTKQVQGALATVDRLFVSLRSMVGGLRPPVLEQLGLIAALKTLASEVMATSEVGCRVLGKKGLPQVLPVAVEGALYRIAQELLMNVVRHAKATEVTVATGSERGGIVLTVEDNGRGFNVAQREKHNRFGLRGVHERVELLGGTVMVSSTRKVGTTVAVHVPIELPGSSQCQMVPDRPVPSRAIKKRRRRGT